MDKESNDWEMRFDKLISLIPEGGPLEVTPLAVKLLDNRLCMYVFNLVSYKMLLL